MFCDNCGKNLNEVNNLQSPFTKYSLVPDKVKFFESKMGQMKRTKERPRCGTDTQRQVKSFDDDFGDNSSKDNSNMAKSTTRTKNGGFADFLLGPDDMKKLIDRANESVKSNLRAIRLIDQILKLKIN